MKLARKIILMMVATFLALLVLFGYREAKLAVRDYDARVTEAMAITGRALRPSFAEVGRVEGHARALDLLARSGEEIQHSHVRWERSRIRWVPASAGGSLSADQVTALARGEEVVVDRRAIDERLYVYVPMAPDGAIELSQPLVGEGEVIARVVKDRVILAGVVALGALVVSVVGGLWLVGRPMRALADHAHRIGQGEWSSRLALRRDDEIGDLAIEMNAMCDQLEEGRRRAAAEADARVTAVEQLRHADRLTTVGTLASGVAHELGTPLSVIAGRAKLVQGGATREEIDQSARVILSQTDKVTKIVRGLLDFARRKPAATSPVDLRDVARRTIDLLAPLAKRADVELALRAPSGAVLVDADVMQIEQVVANIVVNGVHATKGGGEVVVAAGHARVRSPDPRGGPPRAEAEHAWLSVTDRGIGIAPGDLPRIFEPFFTTKDVGEGTGLGLSVAYGIVAEHGGWIDVRSEPGQGASFTLYLPKSGLPKSGARGAET